ncbi:MAG: exosortase-dependent surface protein XDP2 [Planctomycetota bacterium]
MPVVMDIRPSRRWKLLELFAHGFDLTLLILKLEEARGRGTASPMGSKDSREGTHSMNLFNNKMALLCAAGLLGGGTASASMFTFTTNTSVNNGPKGDIILDSVSAGSLGGTFSNFAFAQSLTLISNDPFTGGNSGAASTDRGDNVAAVGGITNIEDPTANDFLNTLANNNLNSIIDGEDNGSFDMRVGFGQTIESVFIWERGGNSRLGLQALDANGALIGNEVVVNSAQWSSAGFQIDTTEIGGSQSVRSAGFSDLAAYFGTDEDIAGLRVFSESSFNGADFKLIAGAGTQIPSPGTGVLLAASLAIGLRRRRKA